MLSTMSLDYSLEYLSKNSPQMYDMLQEIYPQLFEDSKPRKKYYQKASYVTGKSFGKAKNFFSKKETKSATLVAYWAADSIVAVFLLLTTTSIIAFTVASGLLVLHTYATFSAVNEMTK
jgi:hypothetical protein